MKVVRKTGFIISDEHASELGALRGYLGIIAAGGTLSPSAIARIEKAKHILEIPCVVYLEEFKEPFVMEAEVSNGR